MSQRPGVIPARKRRFLTEFRQTANLTESARRAGVHRSMPYAWAKKDPEFAALMKEAEQEAIDGLEQVAHNLATGKYMRRVVSSGRDLGEEPIYSEKMIEFLLRSRRPEVYGNRAALEVGGKGGEPIKVTHQVEASFVANVLAILGDQGGADPAEGRVKLLDSASADD